MDKDCIFCKIVKGEAPSYKVYEDADFMAFLDIRPLAKGHALVIPKKHVRWVQDVEPFGTYWRVAGKVAKAVDKTFDSDYVNFITLGQAVPHAHIHVIPRRSDDKMGELPDWTRDMEFTDGEMKNISDKIRENI